MKAVVYKGNGQIALEERPIPKIIDGRDAIMQVTLTTICSSDIHIKHGAVPRAVPGTILGHEFVGKVVEVGSAVKKIKPGDRVAVNVETFCGECFFCKRGLLITVRMSMEDGRSGAGSTAVRRNMPEYRLQITGSQ